MALQPGTILGRYQIRSVSRAGLTGELYTANDLEGDRSVAIMPLARGLRANPP